MQDQLKYQQFDPVIHRRKLFLHRPVNKATQLGGSIVEAMHVFPESATYESLASF